MKKKIIIGSAAVIAIAAVAVVTHWGDSAGGTGTAPPKDIVVETLAPGRGDIAVEGEYIGSLAYNESVYVFPKTGGMVTATYFGPGDAVRKDDVLFEIDAEPLATQADQARAAYEAASSGARQTAIQLKAALDSAETMRDDAKTNLDRMQQLYDAGAISQSQMEQATSAYDNALLQYETAKSSYDLTVGSGNGGGSATAGAQVAPAREGLRAAEKQLSYAKVTAPMDGIVDRKLVNVYDTASPQSYAYVITNHNSMRVSFHVPEHSIEALSEGDAVTVMWNGKSCEGSIVDLASAIDPANGLFDVKAVIEGAEDLYAGASVKVRAASRRAKDTLLIPLDCIYYEEGVPCVYLLKDGRAVKTEVEVGVFDGSTAEITGGLTMADSVIATWHPGLADGVEVKTVAEAGEASATEEAR